MAFCVAEELLQLFSVLQVMDAVAEAGADVELAGDAYGLHGALHELGLRAGLAGVAELGAG